MRKKRTPQVKSAARAREPVSWREKMLQEIQRVVRLLMLMRKLRRPQGWRSTEGGLLVLLWLRPGNSNQSQHCAELQEELYPSVGPYPDPDPEDLCGFTDMHGPLQFFHSVQLREGAFFNPEWQSRVEVFLRRFSLTNAGLKIHLYFKSNQEIVRKMFSAKIPSKVVIKHQWPVMLEVACSTQPRVSMGKRTWCQGGHPVLGCRLPLSIPPEAMERGLYGELILQTVTLLSPCVHQFPNLATRLTRIQVLVYSPSNLPVSSPTKFFHSLPDGWACQDLGLGRLNCSTCTEPIYSGGTVYTVEDENTERPQSDLTLFPLEQSLCVFLFLQHSDPFNSELSDMIVTEELLEHHLEAILNNNKQAVISALHTDLKNALDSQRKRNKTQETLRSAHDVMLRSALSIVSSSSDMTFRTACLDSMRVRDTHELSASVRETLRRVTTWKFVPRVKCHSAQMDSVPGHNEPTI